MGRGGRGVQMRSPGCLGSQHVRGKGDEAYCQTTQMPGFLCRAGSVIVSQTPGFFHCQGMLGMLGGVRRCQASDPADLDPWEGRSHCGSRADMKRGALEREWEEGNRPGCLGPHLGALQLVGPAIVGQETHVQIVFKNPLPQTLKGAVLHMEGAGLCSPKTITVG